MKYRRLGCLILVAIFSVAFSTSLQALSLGGSVKSLGKKASRSAAQSEYNKKLAKQKCRFTGDSATQYTGCNLDEVIGEMNAFHTAAEGSGFANDVDIIIKASGKDWDLARRRADFLRDKVRQQINYWDYQVRYTKSPSNEVYFQVQVR